MLRITVRKAARSTALKLEGKLVGPWIEELEKTWHSVRSSPDGGRLLVDLGGVTFVDEPGEELLAEMDQGGVHFVADTLLMKDIVQRIKRGPKNTDSDSPRG